jgi:hypothetical protein
MDISQNKDTFIKIINKNVKRDGIENLVNWLKKTDFFEAPASTRYHMSTKGGLCAHSLNVYERLKKEIFSEYEYESPYSDETIALVSLFHDICKADVYKTEMRNVKNQETGKWEQVPYYTFEEYLPLGHGEKSVYIINGFLRLTREEAVAITWHMGGFDCRVKGGDFSINKAFEMFPLAALLHTADLKATVIDEKDTNGF